MDPARSKSIKKMTFCLQLKMDSAISRFSVKGFREKYYSDLKSPFSYFNELVIKYVDNKTVVLHLGCGADQSIGLKDISKFVIGIDLDPWIYRNQDIDSGSFGDICNLPFKNESNDLVISRWVLEHLKSPERSIHEAARVLKPGGCLILLTPNQFHYAGFITRITPHGLQKLFVKYLVNGSPDEVFPTYYRANTIRRIRCLLEGAGLVEEKIEMLEGAPTLLSFSQFTYLAGVAYERLVNHYASLSGFRSAILAIFRKSKSPS
jgi:SAM-dependent methyltransferase